MQGLKRICRTYVVVVPMLFLVVSLSLADDYATAIENGLEYLRQTQDQNRSLTVSD